jgi:hypothetical protein
MHNGRKMCLSWLIFRRQENRIHFILTMEAAVSSETMLSHTRLEGANAE